MHAPESVDREAGEIRNVKVLGFESANGRTYTREAVEKACRMYEGAKVKLDHPKKSSLGEDRSFTETFGVLEGCHCKDDGLYADKLRYKKSHPSAELVAESAENFSDTFGLSHNVRGKTEVREGKTHVIEIERVESVDVVDSPATTNGLFESEQMTTKTLREIREALPSDKKYNGLRKLFEMEGDDMPLTPDAPIDVPGESSADDAAKAAVNEIVMAVLDDESMDDAAKIARIKDILKAKAMLAGTVEKPAAPVEAEGDEEKPEDEEEKPMESKTRRQLASDLAELKESVSELKASLTTAASERDDLKAEKAARALLESNGLKATEARISLLSLCKTDAQREQLMEEWEDRKPVSRPDTSPAAKANPDLAFVPGSIKAAIGG